MVTRHQNTPSASSELIATNLGWLRQALTLVQQLDDTVFTTCPKGLAPHRVGSHLRHVLEFYECFLDGLDSSHLDYDARKRDEGIETGRHRAAEKLRSLIGQLEQSQAARADSIVFVRMENADSHHMADPYLCSSVSRELQALSSHTIHHFALIAITLRAHGLEVDPEFGMSPSTLRFLSTRAVVGTAEAA